MICTNAVLCVEKMLLYPECMRVFPPCVVYVVWMCVCHGPTFAGGEAGRRGVGAGGGGEGKGRGGHQDTGEV